MLVRDGEVLTADEAGIRAEAQVQSEAFARHVAADPVHKGMAFHDGRVVHPGRLTHREATARRHVR